MNLAERARSIIETNLALQPDETLLVVTDDPTREVGELFYRAACAMGRRALVSSHGIHLNADALAEDVDYSNVDMVILPGGIPGTPNLAENKTVTDTCVSFAKAGRKVAAICAAPSILASLGLLEGRNATAHAGFQDKLAGAIVHDEEVVVDGSITTSYGLGGAIPFALELVRQLAGPAEADRIQKAIAYRH